MALVSIAALTNCGREAGQRYIYFSWNRVSTSLWGHSTVNSSGSSSAQTCNKALAPVRLVQAFPLREEQPMRGGMGVFHLFSAMCCLSGVLCLETFFFLRN